MNGFRYTQKLSRTIKKVGRFLVLALALLAISGPLFSQGSTGTIQGGVFDSSGGAIANAKVTVTDVARGISRTLTTDDSGQYAAPALTAGAYTVRAEAAGFGSINSARVNSI